MPIRINLDLDTLRTLSVADELGSLGQAAEKLGRTPSAISLQMKRLQDELGVALFRKTGRKLTLTEAGVVVLDYARRILTLHDELLDVMQETNVAGHIRIGCPQDFASILPSVLSHFSLLHPKMLIELRVEGNAVLADAVEASQIDLAIVIGHENRTAAQTIGHIDLVWISSSSFEPSREQALPLAVLGPQCAFRKCAIQHLDGERISYRLAANSPSLDGLWAVLLGGVGITARTAFNLPEGLISSSSLHGLPALGQMPVTLHRSSNASGAATDRMAMLLSESLRVAIASSSEKKGGSRRVIEIRRASHRKHKLRSTNG